ncbi:protein JTB-like isoform X2 [Coccinella septempunctata]|uniref:protein JTB-like isoform X2 n=1 Tax=Coccinella septempunctata TaxID=41139 RepID=UPI001D06DAD4|nr:protein JTB-like isoform X2 [Coccinella septempunctata]
MIESCPKRRMFLGITVLGFLTILVLIIESQWTEARDISRKRTFVIEQNSTCWQHETYEIIKDCEPCTESEINSRNLRVCMKTHYKELLKCSSGEVVLRSCDSAAYYDERAFWTFELFMFMLSTISFLCFISRQKVLNKRMMQRVQRQLANSV